MSPQLFSGKINVLTAGLNFSTAKNRAISSNIANLETPGYKAFKVIMNEKIGSKGKVDPSVLTRTHPGHISGSKSGSSSISYVQDKSTTMRQDGNNVDLEHELAEMNANTVYYTALSRFTAQSFAGLKKAISEGRR